MLLDDQVFVDVEQHSQRGYERQSYAKPPHESVDLIDTALQGMEYLRRQATFER